MKTEILISAVETWKGNFTFVHARGGTQTEEDPGVYGVRSTRLRLLLQNLSRGVPVRSEKLYSKLGIRGDNFVHHLLLSYLLFKDE